MHRKKQRECPNPLFLKWLEEWRDEAKQKNSKLQYTYAKVRDVNHKHTTRVWTLFAWIQKTEFQLNESNEIALFCSLILIMYCYMTVIIKIHLTEN